MDTINTEAFRNVLLFKLKISAWGNRRQGDITQIETDCDKEVLRLGKKLLQCEAYEAIVRFLREVRSYCLSMSMPSEIDDGLYGVRPQMVPRFEEYLNSAVTRLSSMVDEFLTVYPSAIDDSRRRMNGQFNANDYPSADKMREMFSIGWRWTAFTVPEGLPPAIRDQEIAKMENQMREASEAITLALREGFRELVAHAADRLTVKPGETPKKFKESTIENIREFIKNFEARNLMNDQQLEALVAKANIIIDGQTANDIREKPELREWIATKFNEVRAAVDGMVTVKARKLDLSEE